MNAVTPDRIIERYPGPNRHFDIFIATLLGWELILPDKMVGTNPAGTRGVPVPEYSQDLYAMITALKFGNYSWYLAYNAVKGVYQGSLVKESGNKQLHMSDLTIAPHENPAMALCYALVSVEYLALYGDAHV